MSLAPSEFPAWVEGDRFSYRSGPELSIFRMILFERWAAEDPDGLIAWGIHNDYGQAGRALDTFAKEDPELLIRHFRENPDNAREIRQLSDIASSHPSLALARLAEIQKDGVSSKLDRETRKVLLSASENSIAELEAAIAAMPESIREEAESVLIGRKMQKDFPGEISKLLSDPQGSKILMENMDLLKGKSAELLAVIPDMPDSWKGDLAGNPWKLFQNGGGKEFLTADLGALGFTDRQIDRIMDTGLGYYSYTDPGLVLNNVRDKTRSKNNISDALNSLLRRGNGQDEGTRRMISEIRNPEVREAALNQWEELVETRDNAESASPSGWMASLASSKAGDLSLRQVAAKLRNLDDEKMREYRTGFSGLTGEVKAGAALTIANSAENSSETNAVHGDAILYLAHHPPATDSSKPPHEQFQISQSASRHTVNLAMQDPIAASKWVASLPGGNARKWAAKNLASYWNQYDPAAVSQWMGTLSGQERVEITEYLEKDR